MNILNYFPSPLDVGKDYWGPDEKTHFYFNDLDESKVSTVWTKTYFLVHVGKNVKFLLKGGHYAPYTINVGEKPINQGLADFVLIKLLTKQYPNRVLQQHLAELLVGELNGMSVTILPQLTIKRSLDQSGSIKLFHYGRKIEGKDGTYSLNKHTARKFNNLVKRITSC